MASVRYRKRGNSNLWSYESGEGKTVAHTAVLKQKLQSQKLNRFCKNFV